jgi:hypothetical protein
MGRNFNDLPTMTPRSDTRGIGGSGAASSMVDGGSATSAIPVEQEGDSNSEGNLDAFVVQDNPSVGQRATAGKWSLKADATAGGWIPKRPR